MIHVLWIRSVIDLSLLFLDCILVSLGEFYVSLAVVDHCYFHFRYRFQFYYHCLRCALRFFFLLHVFLLYLLLVLVLVLLLVLPQPCSDVKRNFNLSTQSYTFLRTKICFLKMNFTLRNLCLHS